MTEVRPLTVNRAQAVRLKRLLSSDGSTPQRRGGLPDVLTEALLGQITVVRSPSIPGDPRYDAEAYRNPGIRIENGSPVFGRPLGAFYAPAEVGSDCLIGIDESGSPLMLLAEEALLGNTTPGTTVTGVITEVDVTGALPLYSATNIVGADVAFTLTDVSPLDRPVNPAAIDYTPAGIGTFCSVFFDELGQPVLARAYSEFANTSECPP